MGYVLLKKIISCKKKNSKYAVNVTTLLCISAQAPPTGELVSADNALVIVHQMLQGLFISNFPQVYGYLKS